MGARTRPFVAAALALLVAGLGHAYLRRWGRAAGWFATILGTAIALVSYFAAPAAPPAEWPPVVVGPILALFVLSAVDAYRIAARRRTGASASAGDPDDADAPACPNCGKPLEEDLTFCHWCTTRLDDTER